MLTKNRIYLDYAATTPVDPQVLKVMTPYYMENKFGNASSSHSFGQEAIAAINKARGKIADFLNCGMGEIIFTSGATESNNLAIRGRIELLNKKSVQHIITSQIEHPAVFEVCKFLEKTGVEVSYIGVDKNGVVKLNEIQKAIKENTSFISIMYVNNETGVIQPIREIGKMIKKYNKNIAKEKLNKQKILFHTDATQAINYCNCNVKFLHVDMMSFSAHKIYGPKGVGGLYASGSVNLSPLNYGGSQENGLRSGTYNTAGIVGLGKAIELVEKTKSHRNIIKMKDRIIKEIKEKLPDVFVNGSIEKRIPSNINFSFKNVSGESVMIMLDMEGIAVSTGSACSSSSSRHSRVLCAMNVPVRLSEGSIRITLGKFNTVKEIEYFIEKLVEIIKKLRKISP